MRRHKQGTGAAGQRKPDPLNHMRPAADRRAGIPGGFLSDHWTSDTRVRFRRSFKFAAPGLGRRDDDQNNAAFRRQPSRKGGAATYSFRWPESSTTLRQRSVSALSIWPKRLASPVMATAPSSAYRCLMSGSSNAALISLFRSSMTVRGVPRGAPTP